MSTCDDTGVDGLRPSTIHKEIPDTMKKLVVMMIGLGLVLGSVSFAQDTKDTTKTEKKAKKAKKAKKTTTETK